MKVMPGSDVARTAGDTWMRPVGRAVGVGEGFTTGGLSGAPGSFGWTATYALAPRSVATVATVAASRSASARLTEGP